MFSRLLSYPQTWKRLLDFLAAFFGIILLSPVFLVIALIIKLRCGGAVIYSQPRIGRNFQPFNIYKFRTMTSAADGVVSPCTVKGDPRITKTGQILRKSKLDELPQLFNVLIGDMSLVGPRPEVGQYVEMFKEQYSIVLSVRPGITNGATLEYINEEDILFQLVSLTAKELGSVKTFPRYATPHEAYVNEIIPLKLALYKKYIQQQSFWLDLKIIIETMWKLSRPYREKSRLLIKL